MTRPANTAIACDGSGHWHPAARPLQPDDDLGDFPALTHDFRYNALFADSHVKSKNFGELADLWQAEL